MSVSTPLLDTTFYDISSDEETYQNDNRSLFSTLSISTLNTFNNIKHRILDFYDRNIGLGYVMIAMFASSLMLVGTKLLEFDDDYQKAMHPLQILFVRMIFTVIICWTYMYFVPIPDAPWGPKKFRFLLCLRGVIGFFGVFGLYYSVLYLSVSDAVVITFLNPSIVALEAFIILRENYSLFEGIAATLSFGGVILIARPASIFGQSQDFDDNIESPDNSLRASAVVVALWGVFCAASVVIILRHMGNKVHTLITVQYFSLYCLIVSALGLIFIPSLSSVWPHTLKQWLLLLLVSVCGFCNQFFLTLGVQKEKKAGRAALMNYTQMMWALVWDIVIFNHLPSVLSFIGFTVILGSALAVLLLKPKDNNYNLLQSIAKTANNLHNLIPLGVLYFYGFPRLACQEAIAPDGWHWLSLPFALSPNFTVNGTNHSLSNLVLDLRYLFERSQIRITYKIFGFQLLVLRIYVVPRDIENHEFISTLNNYFSRGKSIHWHQDKYRKILSNLIEILDFDRDSWNLHKSIYTKSQKYDKKILVFPCLKDHFETFSAHQFGVNMHLPFPNYDKVASENQFYLNFHLNRLINQKSVTQFISSNFKIDSCDKILIDLYNSIHFNKLDLNKTQNSLLTSKNNLKSDFSVSYFELEELISNVTNDNIQGFKSSLYVFQRESIIKMLCQEFNSNSNLLPNLFAFTTKEKNPINNQNFYFDIQNFSFLKNGDYYKIPKGGILAENMGLGKTCMCLALICLTKYQLPTVSHDTFSKFLFFKQENLIEAKKVKKLTELCIDQMNEKLVPWRQYRNFIPEIYICDLYKNPPFVNIATEYFADTNLQIRRSQRIFEQNKNKDNNNNSRKILISSSTLIICPDNLVKQWENEIDKHIESQFLNVFLAPIYLTFPDPSDLLDYDIVMISFSTFSRELLNNHSPLLDIYWKRIIVDEGHGMSSKSSKKVELSKKIFAERRWAITGTPTAGLTDLHLNEDLSYEGDTNKTEKNDENPKSLDSSENSNEYIIKGKFSSKDDLQKLGLIISGFLRIEPWSRDFSCWHKLIVKPFFNNSYGSVQKLKDLLNSTIIRHNLVDIQIESDLPPLHHKAIFLNPSFHNKLALNLFTSVLAINAVTSERVDQDYMFHPKNGKDLKTLITNLQRATFYWTGFSRYDVENSLAISEKSLKMIRSNGEPYYNPEDRKLLEKSIKVAKQALSNDIWETNSVLHEMSYFVSGLPSLYVESFANSIISYQKHTIGLYSFLQLSAIQNFFFKNRFLKDEDEKKLEKNLFNSSWIGWDESWKNKDKTHKNSKVTDVQTIEIVEQNLEKQEENSKGTSTPSPKRKSELTIRLTSSNPKSKNRMGDSDYHHDYGYNHIRNKSPILLKSKNKILISETKNAKIIGTLSAKLSYLASRLLEHQLTSIKSLVFYQFEDSAYYLIEILDLLGVNYFLYSSFISIAERNKKLDEFSKFDDGGVCLIMDLKLAAHGLTIVSATRVYFINPVWKKATEAQAIKRCHRIGQNKPVYVETLILKGTLEEEMYKRRHTMNNKNEFTENKTDEENLNQIEQMDTNKEVFEDNYMRDYFSKHEFVEINENELEYSSFLALSTSKKMLLVDDYKFFSEKRFDKNQILKYLKEDKFGLDKHLGIVDKETGIRKWYISLFTEMALRKVNRFNKSFKRISAKNTGNYGKKFIDKLDNVSKLSTKPSDHKAILKNPKKRLLIKITLSEELNKLGIEKRLKKDGDKVLSKKPPKKKKKLRFCE
ncbi:uncharacterized protein ASCRUDRAFT_15071 [Ascoidea rubescens DSM 1968]|uniref:P-loop containing nucleoside triphosphate hydrolase protein n=1 Tax=Ascoidea rubescens DSM 1968 TaxID=1344418 RepID=A0A1D2VBF2_9ASCO|nr:hypothetical protein ASCRUDRAFT_15071 [Ascoidea rubescens DSM 1968]ODV58941.1 hypothetical protein ASCRUDRAFT_15071 [Ascoidea rubescens DSM 1968]